MANQGLEFVEIRVSRGNHELLLKLTGEVLGVYMHRWEALWAGSVVDRALQSVRRASLSAAEVRHLPEARSR